MKIIYENDRSNEKHTQRAPLVLRQIKIDEKSWRGIMPVDAYPPRVCRKLEHFAVRLWEHNCDVGGGRFGLSLSNRQNESLE